MTIAEELRREGREEGRAEGRVSLLEKLLTLKFGELAREYEPMIEAATAEQIERYAARILTAETLAAVFAD